MSSHTIVSDLLRAFLYSGGTLQVGVTAVRSGRGRVIVMNNRSKAYEQVITENIILATGSDGDVLSDALPINVFVSPMLVAVPHMAETNFVRMSPCVSRTINHMIHGSQENRYSVIGNAVYCDPSAIAAHRAAADHLVRVSSEMLGAPPNHWQVYFGRKTTLDGSALRRYLFEIKKVGNCYMAIPGKFSLAFSLAVHVCRYFGINPLSKVAGLADRASVGGLVARPRHETIAAQLRQSYGPDQLSAVSI